LEKNGTNDLYTGGVAISLRFDKSFPGGVKSEGKVKDFIASLPIGINSIPDGRRVVEDMVESYLIDIITIEKGSILHDSRYSDAGTYPQNVLSSGIQEAVSYLDTRKNKININKEHNLADILAYGRIVIGKSFDTSAVTTIANEIMHRTPISFDPRIGPKTHQQANYSYDRL
jgi:hypothetical protein